MDLAQYSTQSTEELYKKLRTDANGLFQDELKKRQLQYGLNEIKTEQLHWWNILLRQLTSPFLYLLIGAACLSIALGERLDGLMIFLFVGLNTLLGFYQEYKSEQTLKLLKKFVQTQAKVIRGGKEEMANSAELVPGDIIVIEPGDIIAADIRLVESNDLTVNESVLTGESVSVTKTTQPLAHAAKEIYQAGNICFSGTTVASGKGKGLVIETGKNTAIGQITKLTTETQRESSFEKGIARFSRFILYLIIFTLAGLFVTNLFIKGFSVDIPNLLIFSIALAVSVIPEGLPVVITFSLSRGALRLAKHKVVVKRLSAIEDLGSIEVLCTDKTGTLTENKLTLHSTYGKESEVILYGALGSALDKNKNQSVHSFDLALLDHLSRDDMKTFGSYERLHEVPFDPVRKRSSVLVEKHKDVELIVRGAAEEVLKLCGHVSEQEKKSINEWIAQESGNRIIAVAQKSLSTKPNDLLKEEKNLKLLGLISFNDPIKKTTHEAINRAKMLGIQIKVLTGDSREVAGSVGHEIGLIDNPSKVITGDEFEKLSAHKQHEAVQDYHIFARVSPQQKYRIIQLLQEKNEVGFLGEGINDAPALKIANVAIVVQEATDVAREASDIILLNKSLNVIVDGIKEGREIFANTTKYIRSTLASNFGNFYTVSLASLFITYLPLLPLQILLINLLTDFPMIAVATDTVDDDELKRPHTYEIRDIALVGTLLGVVSSIFDFIFFALFYKISPSVLQTNWFIGSVLTELLFLFSIRTKLPMFKSKRPSTILLILTGVAFACGIFVPFTTIGHTIFSFVTPSWHDIQMILIVVTGYIISTEAVKVLYYMHTGKEAATTVAKA